MEGVVDYLPNSVGNLTFAGVWTILGEEIFLDLKPIINTI
jgi:hypothetical protein